MHELLSLLAPLHTLPVSTSFPFHSSLPYVSSRHTPSTRQHTPLHRVTLTQHTPCQNTSPQNTLTQAHKNTAGARTHARQRHYYLPGRKRCSYTSRPLITSRLQRLGRCCRRALGDSGSGRSRSLGRSSRRGGRSRRRRRGGRSRRGRSRCRRRCRRWAVRLRRLRGRRLRRLGRRRLWWLRRWRRRRRRRRGCHHLLQQIERDGRRCRRRIIVDRLNMLVTHVEHLPRRKDLPARADNTKARA